MDIKEILERQMRDLDEKSRINLFEINSLKDEQSIVYDKFQKQLTKLLKLMFRTIY